MFSSKPALSNHVERSNRPTLPLLGDIGGLIEELLPLLGDMGGPIDGLLTLLGDVGGLIGGIFVLSIPSDTDLCFTGWAREDTLMLMGFGRMSAPFSTGRMWFAYASANS